MKKQRFIHQSFFQLPKLSAKVFSEGGLLIAGLLLFRSHLLLAQAPAIEWAHSFGGTSHDAAYDIVQTNDGGFIAVGVTSSGNGDVTGHHGTDTNDDFWVVKLNAAGIIEWQKCYGGFDDDFGQVIRQTTDGGYAIAGRSNSTDGDLAGLGAHGKYDYWLIKTDATGTIEWSKVYGGTKDDMPEDLRQTSDGGYILCGTSYSKNGDITDHHFKASVSDIWIVKTDVNGIIQWQKSLGGKSSDFGGSVILTIDGGYLVSGMTSSTGKDVSSNHGQSDYWVIKLDGNGTIDWENTYGGSDAEAGSIVSQTSDGGFVITGNSESSDGDVPGNNGLTDIWTIKTDAMGNLQAGQNFGGSVHESATSVYQIAGGHYIIGGKTNSDDGDVTGFHGGGQSDYWIIQTNGTGNIEWNNCYGGSGDDLLNSSIPTTDGGFIAVGLSSSTNGDVTGNHGNYDFWILKLANPSVNAITTFIPPSGTICPGQSLSVNYSSSGTYSPGNIFSAQLSDATGSFSSPIVIGTVASTVSGIINCTIPPLTPSGTAYRIRVVSSNPVVLGNDNGANLTITCPVPTELGTPGITATSVDLKWQKISAAAGYEVRYRLNGTTDWTTVSSTSNKKTITGLTPDTKYEWSVETQCVLSPLVTSGFSPSKKFTTAPLRIEDQLAVADQSIKVYPNPFFTSTHIDLSEFINASESMVEGKENQLEIFITDLSGRIFSKITCSDLSDVEIGSDLPVGYYLVEVKNQQRREMIVILKSRE